MADGNDSKDTGRPVDESKKKSYWKELPEDRERKTRNKLPQRFEDFATKGEGIDDSQPATASQVQEESNNTQDWVADVHSAESDEDDDDNGEDNVEEEDGGDGEPSLPDDTSIDRDDKNSKRKRRALATKRKRAPRSKGEKRTRVPKKRARKSPTTVGATFSSVGSFGSSSSHGSSSTAFPIMPVEPSATQVKGVDNPAQWKFATSLADILSKSLIESILGGCYFEPGVINGDLKPTVEICFSFDMTGSMSSCLNELKWKLSQCATTLLSDLPNIRIAMIAHGDYCDALRPPMYLMKKMDFTNDLPTFEKFVKSCGASGGGDAEECYEMCLYEAQQLNWSVNDPNCMKVLVMIGDELPHKPERSDLQLNWRVEVENLKKLLGGEMMKTSVFTRSNA